MSSLSLYHSITNLLTVVVALLVFVLLLPLALSLEATRNILVRLGLKTTYAGIPRWVNIIWLLLMAPLAITALVFGGLAGGSSTHLRTAHGVSFAISPHPPP